MEGSHFSVSGKELVKKNVSPLIALSTAVVEKFHTARKA